jgi:hypothetical protein
MLVIDMQIPAVREEVLTSKQSPADLYRSLGVEYDPRASSGRR